MECAFVYYSLIAYSYKYSISWLDITETSRFEKYAHTRDFEKITFSFVSWLFQVCACTW